MKSGKQINNDIQPVVQVVVDASNGRRKLIRGGLVGVPVLLALKSTPVLAGNCKLPSGFSTSGNFSRTGQNNCADPALGPAFWRTNLSSAVNPRFSGTGTPGISAATLFSAVIGGPNPGPGSTPTLLQVLALKNFASLVVAAYLDFKSVPSRYIGGITEADIKAMWNGSFTVSGALWTNTQSENYLRYTMGLQPIPASIP